MLSPEGAIEITPDMLWKLRKRERVKRERERETKRERGRETKRERKRERERERSEVTLSRVLNRTGAQQHLAYPKP